MDRRRWIFVVFVIVLLIAAVDVYSNHVYILDDFGSSFTIRLDVGRPGDFERLPHGAVTRSVTHPGAAVESLHLDGLRGPVLVRGADTDTISISVQVRTLTHRVQDAQPVAEQFELDFEESDGAARVRLVEPPWSPTMRAVETTWDIVVPARLALHMRTGIGPVDVQNMSGPVELEGVTSSVFMRFVEAAPIRVSLVSGQVHLHLHKDALDHEVNIVADPGVVAVSSNVTLQHKQDGLLRTVTGTLGDGTYPLDIHVTGAGAFVTVFE